MIESANQFRPGSPPALTSDRYSDAFDQVKSLGIAGSTTATADEALTGGFLERSHTELLERDRSDRICSA